MAYLAGGYHGFLSMKRLGVLLLSDGSRTFQKGEAVNKYFGYYFISAPEILIVVEY